MTLPTRTTDQFVKELSGYMPVNWFSPAALKPGGNAHALLKGMGSQNLVPYEKLATVERQMLLTNATGDGVDMCARDFFGDNLPRLSGEADLAYKARIIARLFLQAGTRQGMSDGVEGAVGVPPVLVEKLQAQNTGGWASWLTGAGGATGVNSGGWLDGAAAAGPFEFAGPGEDGGGAFLGSEGVISQSIYGPLAWDTGSGSYDTHLGPFQALVTVQQPEPDSGRFLDVYQILALVDSLKPVGTIMWVRVIGPASNNGIPIF